jgi:hypothetical protein
MKKHGKPTQPVKAVAVQQVKTMAVAVKEARREGMALGHMAEERAVEVGRRADRIVSTSGAAIAATLKATHKRVAAAADTVRQHGLIAAQLTLDLAQSLEALVAGLEQQAEAVRCGEADAGETAEYEREIQAHCDELRAENAGLVARCASLEAQVADLTDKQDTLADVKRSLVDGVPAAWQRWAAREMRELMRTLPAKLPEGSHTGVAALYYFGRKCVRWADAAEVVDSALVPALMVSEDMVPVELAAPEDDDDPPVEQMERQGPPDTTGSLTL